jgi:hypothetical protein
MNWKVFGRRRLWPKMRCCPGIVLEGIWIPGLRYTIQATKKEINRVHTSLTSNIISGKKNGQIGVKKYKANENRDFIFFAMFIFPSHADGSRSVLSTWFLLVTCLAYSSTMKMEAVHSSETWWITTLPRGVPTQKIVFFIPLLALTGAWGIHETFRFTSVS